MTYVVTSPCIGEMDHACVDVCPMECFYYGEDQLVIDPGDCIDCGACAVECPVNAISFEDDVPAQYHSDIEKNAAVCRQDPVPAVSRAEWHRRI